MGETDISWTHRPGTRGRTWNPTQGCALKSEGCRNCYAMRQARRFAGPGKPFHGLINLRTGKWTGKARLAEHKLLEPLSWREPSTVFVDSMSDLFYEGFTFKEIAAVFGSMALCPEHAFQILTKRPDRMSEWFQWVEREARDANAGVGMTMSAFCVCLLNKSVGHSTQLSRAIGKISLQPWPAWPLPNVWLGTSVENQDEDHRISDLLATPAAIHFLSCEPLIGPLLLPTIHVFGDNPPPRGIDWVIAGCESGPGARKCSVDWLRSLRDQCTAAAVPFFCKQAAPRPAVIGVCMGPDPVTAGDGSKIKSGGVIELPYLDGVQHAAFPEVP